MVTTNVSRGWLSHLRTDKRRRLRQTLELCGSPLLFASLWFSKLYRPSFHATGPVRRISGRLGVYPVIDHYHEPLIAPERLAVEVEPWTRHLPGIELNEESQLELLSAFGSQAELLDTPQGFSDVLSPYFDNHALPPHDAQALFSMIRLFTPSLVIEVGSGESSRFAKRALTMNAQDDPARSGRLTCIEPFEAAWLEALDVKVIRSMVEDVSPDEFTGLGEMTFSS